MFHLNPPSANSGQFAPTSDATHRTPVKQEARRVLQDLKGARAPRAAQTNTRGRARFTTLSSHSISHSRRPPGTPSLLFTNAQRRAHGRSLGRAASALQATCCAACAPRSKPRTCRGYEAGRQERSGAPAGCVPPSALVPPSARAAGSGTLHPCCAPVHGACPWTRQGARGSSRAAGATHRPARGSMTQHGSA